MSSCLDEFIFHTSKRVAIPAIPAIPEPVSSHNSHPFKSVKGEFDALLPEQISSTENLLDLDDTHDHIQEHLEERAAIMEYDGGLTRKQAETEARRNMRVYEYRLTDSPDSRLTMIAPGCDLEEARESLHKRFGDRLLDVHGLQRR
jgi:hypothetical protein